MIALSSELKQIFFNVLKGKIGLQEFEQWVYNTLELEKILSEEHYLNLISLNYSQPAAKNELHRLLENVVDLGEYETFKIKLLIDEARLRNSNLPKILESFYDLYCHGYDFMNNLGMGFGFSMTYSPEDYTRDRWRHLNPKELQAFIDTISPGLEEELNRVEQWLESRKVVPTAVRDELNHYEYIDSRNDEEKQARTKYPIFITT